MRDVGDSTGSSVPLLPDEECASMREAANSSSFFFLTVNIWRRDLSLMGALPITDVAVIRSTGNLERAVTRVCVHLGMNVVR